MAVKGILNIGFTVIGSITLIVSLIKMKERDDKYLGITAYGDRGSKFSITETGFRLDEKFLPFDELQNLTIYVDEYLGMRRDLIGVHHGGNNEISFIHQGKPFKIFYIIKSEAEFKKIDKLVSKIEGNLKQAND